MVGAIYGILLIAAAAAPAPTNTESRSAGSVVADQLKADATLLSQRAARPKTEATSP